VTAHPAADSVVLGAIDRGGLLNYPGAQHMAVNVAGPVLERGVVPGERLEGPVGRDRHRIVEFEGLRGCLAWWVVLFHLYQYAGVKSKYRVEVIWAGYGWVGVEVFIILSGFVITLLLESQHERYPVYLTRRFFRLAPVYYALLAVQVAIDPAVVRALDHFWTHVLLHLTILHGLVPQEVLKDSATSLILPAWSISVEWQFYLAAPLVVRWVARGRPAQAVAVLAACAVATYLLAKRFTFAFEANVVMRAGLFGVGIASYYLYRYAVAHPEAVRPLARYLLPVGVAVAWVFHSPLFGSGMVWLVAFSAVLASRVGAETWLTRPVRAFLSRPVLDWLGKVSYSTYLCHALVLEGVIAALGSSFTRLGERGRVGVLVALGFPLIVAASAALHALVEKPGMALGKRLASALRDRGLGLADDRRQRHPAR
jgi:peptidoglycan/LPS O-acetylase OafA/YrhL